MDVRVKPANAELKANDVRLTMGGEPTFVSIDDMESAQWNVSADGEQKRELAYDLTLRLRSVWSAALGEDVFHEAKREGMGAEDFPFFTIDPDISSVYWVIGGTPQADFDREAAGGEPVRTHHSPLFKITPEPAVASGVEATVVALRELLQAEAVSSHGRDHSLRLTLPPLATVFLAPVADG